jgi:uncharacterized membrane protein
MSTGNSFDAEPTLFSALLTPHRSLNRAGFLLLMGFISVISFVSGLVFLSMGAWPVLGFFGLDVLAIYWAFRVNFHRATAYEEIAVTPTTLHVRRVTHLGAVSEWSFNPLWVRLDVEASDEFGVERLALVSRGRSLGIASFLGPDEKLSFSKALSTALANAKRGVEHNPLS